MTTIQKTKNKLISRILASKNEEFLLAVDVIFETNQPLQMLSLSDAQIEMLLMSENDIASGNLISEEEIPTKLSELQKEFINIGVQEMNAGKGVANDIVMKEFEAIYGIL